MPSISAQNIRISMRGSIAYVTCEEVVEPRRDPGTLKTNFKEINENFGNGPAEMIMCAVQVYVKRNGEYALTHHSSSPRGPINF
jgi:hypothetical protein